MEIGVIASIATIVVIVITGVIFFNRMETRQERIIDFLDKMSSNATKEHTDLLNAIKDLQKQQQDEHRDMIALLDNIKTPLIEMNAKLDAHIVDEKINKEK